MVSNLIRNAAQKQAGEIEKKYGSSAYGGTTWLENQRKKKEQQDDDIAPITTVTKRKDEDEEEDGKLDFFQRGAIDDGIIKTILGTVADAGVGVTKGAFKMVEGLFDAGTYGVAGVSDFLGLDSFADKARKEAQKNVVDDSFKGIDSYLNQYSMLGRTSDAILEGLGQVGAIVATPKFLSIGGAAGAAGLRTAGTTAVTTGTIGLSSTGSGMSEAYQSGATDKEAAVYGLVNGVAEAGSELIFGGMGKAIKAVGLSKGLVNLDDVFAQKVTSKITNNVAKNFVEYGIKASAEGVEEVLAGVSSAVGKKLTYMSEEELSDLIEDENLLEQFVVGAVTSGIAQSGLIPKTQSGSLIEANKTGRDFITGMTAAEQSVIDRVYTDRRAAAEKNGEKLDKKQQSKLYDEVLEALEKGDISIDTIEEVLGGDTYKTYRDTIANEDALKNELKELRGMENGKRNDFQNERLDELKAMNLDDTTKRDGLKSKLDEIISKQVKDTRLAESYAERDRRRQAFTDDVEQYEGLVKENIQRIIDKGQANNGRKSREFFSFAARLTGARGVKLTTAKTDEILAIVTARKGEEYVRKNFYKEVKGKDGKKELVLAKIPNACISDNGELMLNVDSPNLLSVAVGHDLLHTFEGDKHYNTLAKLLNSIDIAKVGDERHAAKEKLFGELYGGIEDTTVEQELNAELLGEYVMTNEDFIKRLLLEDKNAFQKVWDRIKYICKYATAGSQAERDLLRAERIFEKMWREGNNAQKNAAVIGGVKYSIKRTSQMSYPVQLQQIEQGKINGSNSLYVGTPSEQLLSVGMSNAPFAMNQGDYKKSRRESAKNKNYSSHAVPYAFFEKMPQYLSTAPMLIDNGEKVTVVTDYGMNDTKDQKSFVIAGVLRDATMESDTINQVKSVYPWDDFATQIKRAAGAGKLVVTNKNKAEKMLVTIGVQPAEVLHILNLAKGTLSQTDPKVKPKFSLSGNTGKQLNSDELYSRSYDMQVEENNLTRFSLSKNDSEGRELSLAIQKRFGNSKVVDENGDLKPVYHGTATGAFTIFDKTKGSVEGDYGSGFYFTDNEADVEEHYEGGGPDFDNKVGRRADEILNEEEGIEYEEAERRAREELFKGAHKFEVYLNIENPAIVGETMLFDPEGYLENYDEEDYEDYDDYIADVAQIVADDIDNIVWEVGRNVDVNDTDGISGILWDAYADGGIGLEDLKARIDELYLEDSEGNFVGNEVARQIIESLGYDGIIDPTVSGKWNMDIEEGTTHYIVFKPNQIKAVTNENPTDNPDIHFSISRLGSRPKHYGGWNVTGKDIALETAPVAETAPVQTEAALTAEDTNTVLPDDFAPISEEDANALRREGLESLVDTEDIPPEIEAPYYEDEPVTADDPFEQRDINAVGNRKVKAYMYENPEVKPFFQSEASIMLGELQNTTKGERWYNDELYYESNGEYGFSGTKRYTSDDIAYLLDERGYTYEQIEKGLRAIIEDNGKENNACSKRIEFLLNDRLKDGYVDFQSGMEIPPDQNYIKLLNEKQITEYSREAFDSLTDNDVPLVDDMGDFAPVKATPKTVLEEQQEAWTEAKEEAERKVHEGKNEAAHIAEIMDEEPNTDSQRNKRAWAKFKAAVLDKGAVFEDLSLKTKNRELIAKWNYTLSSEARAQRFISNGGDGVKSLNAIREEVGSKEKLFSEYLYHMHNIDRMSLDTAENITKREQLRNQHFHGMSDKEIEATAMEWITRKTPKEHEARIRAARAYMEANQTKNKPVFGEEITADVSRKKVKEYEAAHPEFKEYAKDVYAYMNALRKQLVDNGVISQETADLWAQMYPHYVPIRRKGDKGLAVNVPLDSNKTGINAPIKRATGGSRDILPLFDTMGQRTIQTFKAIAKNSFGVELKNSLESDSATVNEVSGVDEIIDSIDIQEGLLQEGKDGNNPTFTVFEDGKRVTFEITEDMYDALKPVSEGLAYTFKPANAISNIRRGLLTEYNPVFMLTNAIKDVQDVLVNSQHPARTYAKIPEAFASMLKKGYWYNEYLDNGGEQNTYFDKETNTFTEDKGLAKLLNSPPFSTVSALNNFIERIPRLAEYIASREAGQSVETSMLDAARVTTNFAAGGDLTKFLNRNGATFLNASVQGAMQQVRNIREAHANGLKGYMNLAVKFAIAGAPTILLNSLVWDDDEEYEELSDYVKQNYYIVGKTEDGTFIRLPKGRTLAVIQNGIEQAGNLVTGDDEADLNAFLDLLINNLAPNNPFKENIISPISQVRKNETWYGEDLVSDRMKDLPVVEQHDESTDAFSKWLGEQLNVSPIKINYLLDQYSGGIGDMILPTLTPEAERAGNPLFAPFVDKFTTDSVMKNQNVSDFYSAVDELTVNANASGATVEDLLKNKYINSVSAELSELYKEKRDIQNSDLPNDEKYDAIREIQKEINDMAREGLETYDDITISGNYATVGDRHYKKNEKGEWQKLSDEQLEKQNKVTSGLGISASAYWSNKEEYDYAYENPEKYTVARAVGGYNAWRGYSRDLYDIHADKDENGKSINGSRKDKVIDYINAMDADYGAKIILFKSEYPADDTYNDDIVDYLNSRNDLSYEDIETILKELGAKVSSDGYVTWD